MLVRILAGAGLFILGYMLGRARRPTIVMPGSQRTARISELLSSHHEQRQVQQRQDSAS